MGQHAGRRRSPSAGHARRSLPLAAALLLVLAIGVSIGASVGDRLFLPELGLFQITLPAGTSYVSLPLVPLESEDPLEVFGPEALAATSIESFDPASGSFQPFFPARPNAAAGSQRLFGNVVRVSVSQQLSLSIRGTPAQQTVAVQIAASAGLEYAGATTTQDFTLRSAVESLEQSGRFRRASDRLEVWNLEASRFDSVSADSLAGVLRPGAVLRLPRNAGATNQPGPQPAVTFFSPQPEVALDGAAGADAKSVRVVDYPVVEAAPAAPFPLTEFRARALPSGGREGIARMALPASLLAMTDLPPTVPVRVRYSAAPNPVPIAFEVLGLSGFKVGGSGQRETLSGGGSLLPMTITTAGELYGRARAPFTATRSGAASGATTLEGLPVSIYFQDSFSAPVLTPSGAESLRTGPVLDIGHSLSPGVRIFRRYARGSQSAMPGASSLTTAAPDVFGTRGSWLEYEPRSVGLLPAARGAWAPRTLPATLRTVDGAALSSVDVSEVASAAVRFSWLPAGAASLQAIPPFQTARTMTYFPSGEAELALATRVGLRTDGSDVAFVLSDPAVTGFELTVAVVPETAPGPAEPAAAALEGLSLKPLVRFRAAAPGQTAAMRLDRLLLSAQPQGGGTIAADRLFATMTALIEALAAPAATWGKAKSNPLQLESELQQIRDAVDSQLRGLAFSATAEATFADTANAFTQQLTLDLGGTITWPRVASGAPPGTSFTLEAAGAYRDAGDGDTVGVAVSLAREFEPGTTVPSERIQFSIGGEFGLPAEWGFGSKTASGQWVYQHEQDPQGNAINQGSFRAEKLLSFKSSLGGIDGLDWLDVAPGGTEYELDLAAFEARLAAAQSGTTVTRSKRLEASLWAGVRAANPEEDASVRGLLLGLALERSSTAVAAVGGKPPKGSPGFLTALFGGPGIFSEGTAPKTRSSIDTQFQGFSTPFVRLDSARASFEVSGTLGLELSAAFRFRRDDPWADCAGVFEQTGNARALDLAVDGVQITRASPGDAYTPDFVVTSAGASLAWNKGEAGPFAGGGRASFGGDLAFSGGLLESAGVDLRVDVDLATRVGRLSGELPGPLFCKAGGSDCPIRSGRVRGVLDLSAAAPRWNAALDLTFSPPWFEGESDAQALGTVSGQGNALTFQAVVTGGFPRFEFPKEVGGSGGSALLKRLGVGYDAAKKLWSYEGAGRLVLPKALADTGEILKLPRTADVQVQGQGKTVSFQLALDPPFELHVVEGFDLGFRDLRFTREIAWEFGMKTRLHAGSLDLELDTTFDAKLNLFRLVPPPSLELKLALGGANLKIKGFSLELFPSPKVGGYGFRLGGLSNLGFQGRGFDGLLAMDVDSLGNFSLELGALPGKPLFDFPKLPGIDIKPSRISIGSILTPEGLRSLEFDFKSKLKLDASIFGPLGGFEIDCISTFLPGGGIQFTALQPIGPFQLKLPKGGPELPFELLLRNLTVLREAGTGEVSFQSDCKLSVLRPLNAFFGAADDRPFTVNAKLGVGKVGGEKQLFFLAEFTPPLSQAFRLLGAAGNLVVSRLLVASRGELDLAATLELREPIKSTLDFDVSVTAAGQYRFTVKANPRLKFDLAQVSLNFSKIGFTEVFPGFMGAVADFTLETGNSVFGFTAQPKDFVYILPNSIPPYGFPFFDKFEARAALLGFAGEVSLSNPLPEVGLNQAVELAAGLFFAFGRNDFGPLRNFLKDVLTGKSRAVKGPGIGDLSLGLPELLDNVFPGLKKSTFELVSGKKLKVLELPLWEGMHYALDLFPGESAADGIVAALKLARVLTRAFGEPAYLIELIPAEVRANELEFRAGGLAAAKASYSIKKPEVKTEKSSSAVIPAFADLGDLMGHLDSDRFPSMAEVVRAAAAGEKPAPLKEKEYERKLPSGAVAKGTVSDNFLPLRDHVDRALALAKKTGSASGDFDADVALIRHLREIANEYGGSAGFSNGQMVSVDGRARMKLTGDSPSVSVVVPGVAGTVFEGAIPLGGTKAVTVREGTLSLISVVRLEDRKLVSELAGSFSFRSPASVRELGVLATKTLARVDSLSFVPRPDAGVVDGWTVEYDLDGNNRFLATYSDLGTLKFVAPGARFTAVMPGSALAEVRSLLESLEPFTGAVFATGTSPYVLGLKVWALLQAGDLEKRVQSVKTDDRTVRIKLKDKAGKRTLELRIVLEDIAYYLAAGTAGEPGAEVLTLEGETPLKKFRVSGDQLLAQPFTAATAGDATEVRDLVIFDGGPKVRSLLDRSERQRQSLLQTDLQQFAALGLTVGGDPLIVRKLKVELDGPSLRAVLRPGSIKFERQDGDRPLAVRLSNDSDLLRWQRRGPAGDSADYPSSPGLFLTGRGDSVQEIGSVFDLNAALGANVLARTVTVDEPATLKGTFSVLGKGQMQGEIKAGGRSHFVASGTDGMAVSADAAGGRIVLFRSKDGEISGTGFDLDVSAPPAPSGGGGGGGGGFRNVGDLFGGGLGGVFGFFKAAEEPFAKSVKEAELILDPEGKAGGYSRSFEYITGNEPGAFKVSFSVNLDLGAAKVKFSSKGVIESTGKFDFKGDVDLTLLGSKMKGAKFAISSDDGVAVSGGWKYLCFDGIDFIGRISKKGRVTGTADANFSRSGTGLYGKVAVDSDGNPLAEVRGTIKFFGTTIHSGVIEVDKDGFYVSLGYDIDSAGVDLDLAFSTDPLKIAASVTGYVDTHIPLVGEISFSKSVKVGLDGELELEFDLFSISVNVRTGDFDFDVF